MTPSLHSIIRSASLFGGLVRTFEFYRFGVVTNQLYIISLWRGAVAVVALFRAMSTSLKSIVDLDLR